MTLGILLPSRGRPANFERFLRAVIATANDWHLFLRFDSDDPCLMEYWRVFEEEFEKSTSNVSIYHGKRVGFGASLNELAAHADAAGMTHVGMFGDDVLPITPGWDTQLIEALRGELGVAYGDDGLRDRHSPDLPTHYITQTEVYRRLGYLSPPGFKHLYLDNVAREVGLFLGNFQYVPVSIKHLHPWSEGEQYNDLTYIEGGRNARIRAADRRAYARWCNDRTWKERLR